MHKQVVRSLEAQGLEGPGDISLWCMGHGMTYSRQQQMRTVCPSCAGGERIPGVSTARVSYADDDAYRSRFRRDDPSSHGAGYGSGVDFGRRYADYEPFTNHYTGLRAPEDRLSALNRDFEPRRRSRSRPRRRSRSSSTAGRASSAAPSSSRRRRTGGPGPSRLSREW